MKSVLLSLLALACAADMEEQAALLQVKNRADLGPFESMKDLDRLLDEFARQPAAVSSTLAQAPRSVKLALQKRANQRPQKMMLLQKFVELPKEKKLELLQMVEGSETVSKVYKTLTKESRERLEQVVLASTMEEALAGKDASLEGDRAWWDLMGKIQDSTKEHPEVLEAAEKVTAAEEAAAAVKKAAEATAAAAEEAAATAKEVAEATAAAAAEATTTNTETEEAANPTTTTKAAEVATTTEKAAEATTTTKAAKEATTTTKAPEEATTTTKAAEEAATTTKAAEEATTTTKAPEEATTTTKAAEEATTTTKAPEEATTTTTAAEEATTTTKAPEEATTTTKAAEEATTTTKAAEEATTTTRAAQEATTTTKAAEESTTTTKAPEEATTTTNAAEEVTTTTKAAEEATTTTKAAEEATTTTKAAEEATTTTKAAEEATTTTKAVEEIHITTTTQEVTTTTTRTTTTITTEWGGHFAKEPLVSPISGSAFQFVSSTELQTFNLVNEKRREGFCCTDPRGQAQTVCYPAAENDLIFDCRLWWASKLHSEDMAKRQYYSHQTEGTKENFQIRTRKNAWEMTPHSEILNGGNRVATPVHLVAGWLGSYQHCLAMGLQQNGLVGVATAPCDASISDSGSCQFYQYWAALFTWTQESMMRVNSTLAAILPDQGLDQSCLQEP